MTDEECPLTANPCRHCSSEHAYRPYMKVEKDPRTGLFAPKGLGQLRIDLGHYCNNIGCWCHELESCPMPDDLIRQGEMIEENKLAKEKERAKEEKREVRKRVVKPVKKVTKTARKPVVKKVAKKPATKSVTKTKPMVRKVDVKGVTKRKP